MVKGRQDPRVSRAYKKQRLVVLARDGYVCHYCGETADTVDHIQSIKNGGDPMSLENMVSACRRCNSAKGSRSQGAFLARTSTPPAFPILISPRTTGTVPNGPCVGQNEQD
ncbi:McrA Restriction endonuclease [uncultured Caudovirales phage]|uniref:McrA Restriction endonuclease n=1 Tax=uncultured Caudovirales phage TaxID=2100421 RepID=A0A6J5NQT6_9CAUD|nr:McrA Restriction endonuclease [uncultured Caudovirales phage]